MWFLILLCNVFATDFNLSEMHIPSQIKEFKSKCKVRLTNAFDEDIANNVVDNLWLHVVDFVADYKKLPCKIKCVASDLVCGLAKGIQAIWTGKSDEIHKRYDEEREKCHYLGGNFKSVGNTPIGHCEFPFTLTGCLGLCAHGVDFYGGFEEEVIENSLELIKGYEKNQQIMENNVTPGLVKSYDGIMFDEDRGCSCYKRGVPRHKTINAILGEKVFNTKLEDFIPMKNLVRTLDKKVKCPKLDRNAKYRVDGKNLDTPNPPTRLTKI